MKFLIWFGYCFIYGVIVTVLRNQGILLGGIPTMLLAGMLMFAASATCKAYERKRNKKKATKTDDVAKAANDLGIATIEAVERFGKANPSDHLFCSIATKTDTIIFSQVYLANVCIMSTRNRELSSLFAEKYVDYIHGYLTRMHISNPSFHRIYRERVVFYDRVFASKQEMEEKTSALIDKFIHVIQNDILNDELAPYSESSPLVITGDLYGEMMCAEEVAAFGKFLLSYTYNHMNKVMETIK